MPNKYSHMSELQYFIDNFTIQNFVDQQSITVGAGFQEVGTTLAPIGQSANNDSWLWTATKYVFRFAADTTRTMCSFAIRLSRSSGISICARDWDSASTTSGRNICSWKIFGTNPNCSWKKAHGWKFESGGGLGCKYGPVVSNHSTGSGSREDSIEGRTGSPASKLGPSAFARVQSSCPKATIRIHSRIFESSNPAALSASMSCLHTPGA